MTDHPGHASREGERLILKHKTGEQTLFNDRHDVKYAYDGSAFGTSTILEIIEEGWSALLILTPHQVPLRLPGLPLFAADGERFATLSLDIDAGYRPNTVQVWQGQNRSFYKQYELTDFPERGGPLHIRWTTLHSLEVQVITLDQLFENRVDHPIILTIALTPQGWDMDVEPENGTSFSEKPGGESPALRH